MDVQLRVDWIRCDGYGLCGDLAPDVIELDEWRYPIVRAGALEGWHIDEVQRAVDCCPMKALIVEPIPFDRRPARAAAARRR
jgi:ferredoxin